MKYYFKCPSCQSDDRFSVPSEDSSGLGCLLVFFGGFIPALLYSDATRRRVQCSNCGFIFRQPPLPRTPVSILASWVIGVMLVFSMLTFLMIAFPELTKLIPDNPVISTVETAVAGNPRAVVFGVLPMMALLFLLSIITSFSSNRRAHQELRKRYEAKPTSFSDAREKSPTRGSSVP